VLEILLIPSTAQVRDLRGNNIPIDRRAQALRPYSNGFCPQCRGELRSPKRKNGESPWGTLWYFIHDYNAQQGKGLSRHHYYRITTRIMNWGAFFSEQ